MSSSPKKAFVKVFVLGRPGSGKSTAYRDIEAFLKQKYAEWSVIHINDYHILYEKSHKDEEHKQFRLTPCDGFDVLDPTLYDYVLKELEAIVQECLSSANNQVVLIEFARDDYRHALKQFDPEFLQDAYFLFIDADIETCLERIHQRIAHPMTRDDHPSISDDLFRDRFYEDHSNYMRSKLKQEYPVNKSVKVIRNVGSREEFNGKVEQFINTTVDCESPTVQMPRISRTSS